MDFNEMNYFVHDVYDFSSKVTKLNIKWCLTLSYFLFFQYFTLKIIAHYINIIIDIIVIRSFYTTIN